MVSARSRRKRRRRTFVASSGSTEASPARSLYPVPVDSGQVTAHYDKGVLKIHLAKKAEAKPKQIKVNVGSEKALEAKVHTKAA